MRIIRAMQFTPAPHTTQNWHLEKPAASGKRGMVVAQAKSAAEAGVAVLDAGGNAIDAAVATALALAAVEPWNSGLGGIGHALIHRAGEARADAVDFGPTAPAALDPSRFKLTGKVAADLFGWPAGRGRRQHPRAALVRDPVRGRGLRRDAQTLGQAAARRDRRAGDRARQARPAAGLAHDAEGRELGRDPAALSGKRARLSARRAAADRALSGRPELFPPGPAARDAGAAGAGRLARLLRGRDRGGDRGRREADGRRALGATICADARRASCRRWNIPGAAARCN